MTAATQDATRTPARTTQRIPLRRRNREPHEKYQLAANEIPRGMDAQWVAVQIRGQPNPRLADFIRSGWRPAKAEDYPELSGLDVQKEYDESLFEAGYIPRVKATDAVIKDGLMLVMRPTAMSAEAAAEEEKKSRRQVEDHLHRLRMTSTRQIGADRTKIRRAGGPVDPDFAADDDALERTTR